MVSSAHPSVLIFFSPSLWHVICRPILYVRGGTKRKCPDPDSRDVPISFIVRWLAFGKQRSISSWSTLWIRSTVLFFTGLLLYKTFKRGQCSLSLSLPLYMHHVAVYIIYTITALTGHALRSTTPRRGKIDDNRSTRAAPLLGAAEMNVQDQTESSGSSSSINRRT